MDELFNAQKQRAAEFQRNEFLRKAAQAEIAKILNKLEAETGRRIQKCKINHNGLRQLLIRFKEVVLNREFI